MVVILQTLIFFQREIMNVIKKKVRINEKETIIATWKMKALRKYCQIYHMSNNQFPIMLSRNGFIVCFITWYCVTYFSLRFSDIFSARVLCLNQQKNIIAINEIYHFRKHVIRIVVECGCKMFSDLSKIGIVRR